jgi:hypothetical protein
MHFCMTLMGFDEVSYQGIYNERCWTYFSSYGCNVNSA